jgi:hypothetical protein
LLNGTCEIGVAGSNILTLKNLFVKDFVAGTQLKLNISSGSNPLGSRAVGPWSIRSEILVDGTYYVVDS